MAPLNPPVHWPDVIDDVFDRDLTAVLGCVNHHGGVALAVVAPCGLRDRARGVVSFTSSRGFGRKLDLITRDDRVALCFHTREHRVGGEAHGVGKTQEPVVVLVQGRASVRSLSPGDEPTVRPAVERHLGPIARGWFWDRWLAAYYLDRVIVDVTVERIVHFCDGGSAPTLAVLGRPLGDGPVAEQRHPVSAASSRAATLMRRVVRQPHRLVGALDGEGFPTIVPITEVTGNDSSVAFTASAARLLPAGGRRAVVIGHRYRPQLVGLETRQVYGWMDGASTRRSFTARGGSGLRVPASKTLILLVNGFLARRHLGRQDLGRHDLGRQDPGHQDPASDNLA